MGPLKQHDGDDVIVYLLLEFFSLYTSKGLLLYWFCDGLARVIFAEMYPGNMFYVSSTLSI